MLIGEKNKDIDKYTDFYLSGIYAHGKLELALGIDYLYACNQKFFEKCEVRNFVHDAYIRKLSII